MILALFVSLLLAQSQPITLNECVGAGDVIAVMYPDGARLITLPGLTAETRMQTEDYYAVAPGVRAEALYSDVVIIVTTEQVAIGEINITRESMYLFVYGDPHSAARFEDVYDPATGDWHGRCFGRVIP